MKNSIITLITILFLTGCFNESSKKEPVAKIGRITFSADDINNRIKDLEPQMQSYFEQKENKLRLVNQIVDEEILYQLAKKERLQRDTEFKKTLHELKRQALINFFIQKKVDNQTEISKKEVEDYYSNNVADFQEYEARNLSHILVKTKEEAIKIRQRIKNGESFEKLAQQLSIDQQSQTKNGEIGWVKKSQLTDEFSNPAFKLSKKNAISGVVQTQYGYHIIKFNDSRIVPKKPLENVFNTIKDRLLSEKKREAFQLILENGKASIKTEILTDNL